MRTAVMEGTLADFDLSSVIQVVSLGRQYTGVELLDDDGRVVGTMFLKSGKILAARSGSLSGLDAVTTLLRSDSHKRFTVYRTESFADSRSPVGSVGEVLLKMMASEARAPERVSVMEGSLTEFDLMSILQVISIGRQFTGVELFDAADRLLGRIELKSGMVVSASAGDLSGVDAIARLIGSPKDTRFVVHRSQSDVGERYLGPLAQILMNLPDAGAPWDAEEANTTAQRADAPQPSAAAAPAPRVAPQAVPGATKGKSTPEDRESSRFVDTYTSPFGLTTLPLPAGDIPVICVTSPKGGAGKTTVALNLGIALARQRRRVILIDSDFNGVLLALGAKVPARGAYDVVAGRARLADATLKTRIPGLRIVPSGDPAALPAASRAGWAQLFLEAKADADVVLVDTPAGLHGPGATACEAATHALVVVAAEPAGLRALPAHLQRLEVLGSTPPKVAGIVLNMLDFRTRASVDVLRDLCSGPSAPWVFDVPIARSSAFMEAVARGVPVCRGDRDDAPTIGWVFEMLASGILERLGITKPTFDDAPLVS